jgi:uncharacterized protein (TIGR02266 family)
MNESTPDLVTRFVELERRRQQGALAPDELSRWQELHERLEVATGCVRPAGAERRDAIRVRSHLEVQVNWDATRDLVRAHDLSEGGVFLQTEHPSEPGTEVHLELSDGRGRTLALEGTVVWVRQPADRLGTPGMGIKFRNLDDWDRAVLVELVEAALRAL